MENNPYQEKTDKPRFNMGGFFPTRPSSPTAPPIVPRMGSAGDGGAVPGSAFQPPALRSSSTPESGGGYRYPVGGIDFSGLMPELDNLGTNRPRPAKNGFQLPVSKPAVPAVAPADLESPGFSVYSPNDFQRLTGVPAPAPSAAVPPASPTPVPPEGLGVPDGWTEFEGGGRARLSQDPSTPMQDMGKEVHDYFDVTLPSGAKARIPQSKMDQMLGLVTTGKTQDERNHDQNGFIMPTATRTYDPNAKTKGDLIRAIPSPTARAEAYKNPEAFFASQKRIAIGEGTLNDFWRVGDRRTSEGDDYGKVTETVADNRMIQERYGRRAGQPTTRVRTRKKTSAEWLAEKNAPGLKRVADRQAVKLKQASVDREDAVTATKHENDLELERTKQDGKSSSNAASLQLKTNKFSFNDDDGKSIEASIEYTFNPDTGEKQVKHNAIQTRYVKDWKDELKGLDKLEAAGEKRVSGMKGRNPTIAGRRKTLTDRLAGFGVEGGGSAPSPANGKQALGSKIKEYEQKLKRKLSPSEIDTLKSKLGV